MRRIYNKALAIQMEEIQKGFREGLSIALAEAAVRGCNAIQITKRKAKEIVQFTQDGFVVMEVGDTWIITFKSDEDDLRVWGGKIGPS